MYQAFSDPSLYTCKICKYAPIAFQTTGTCVKCGVCQWCGVNAALDLDSRRCGTCRCQQCKTVDKTIKAYADDKFSGMLCVACAFKKFPDKFCSKCKTQPAQFGWRGNLKRASLCERCAFPCNHDRKANPLSCTWCNNPGRYQRNTSIRGVLFIACQEHSRTQTCFKGACTPQKQCVSCFAIALAGDDNRHNLNDPVLKLRQSSPPIFYSADAPKFRRKNRSQRFIGSELEIAGIGKPNFVQPVHKAIHDCMCDLCLQKRKLEILEVAKKWGMGIMRDGSLPQGGFEIVTAPAAGDQWLQEIQELCGVLRRCQACREAEKPSCTKSAYVTPACGLHVHIDARDFAYADIRKLIRLYAPLEGVLLRTQPADRILRGYSGQQFARPCAKKYLDSIENIKIDDDPRLWYKAAKRALNIGLYGENYAEKAPKSERYNDARYNFMNLHSWYVNGTIECRGHSGTIRQGNIMTWGMIWANILDAAFAMSEKDIQGLMNSEKSKQDVLLEIATRNTTSKGAQQIERYLRMRWREFESGYEKSEF